MTSLVVATRNPHKVAEIQAILGPGFDCRPLSDFPDAPHLVEDGDSFAANAEMKALQLARWLAGRDRTRAAGPDSPSLVLADDSGLEVDALGGAPGVRSARFAAGEPGSGDANAPDAANNAKLMRLMADVPPARRTARFRCVLALAVVPRGGAPGAPSVFDGVCEGRLALAPQGRRGFGYDPLFVPEGYTQSFGELGDDVKNSLSHRCRALVKLRRHLEAAGGQ